MIHHIKNHKVRHGNVEHDLSELLQGEKADVFYSDPPWGEGNLKYWQTMNQKMTGAEPQGVDLTRFLNRIFSLASKYTKSDGVIFIEYGVRWREQILQMGFDYGLRTNGVIDILYANNLPLDLHIFSFTPTLVFPDNYFNSVKGTKGYKTLQAAVPPFAVPGGTLMDLCCGMGYSAQIALDCGMRFVGNELNEARLAKTIARLEK